MALPSSGALSIQDIVDEFGGDGTLTSYYRGGTYVADTADNSGVPTSGAISVSDFYGASAFSASLSGSFGSNLDVTPDSTQTSGGTVTVNMSSSPLTLVLSGQGGPSVSVNGGSFSSAPSRSVNNGDTLRMRLTASSSYATTHTGTVTLTGATGTRLSTG